MFQINDNLVLRIGLYVTSTLAPHIGLYVGLHVTPPSQLRAVSLRFRLAAASHSSGSPKLFIASLISLSVIELKEMNPK